MLLVRIFFFFAVFYGLIKFLFFCPYQNRRFVTIISQTKFIFTTFTLLTYIGIRMFLKVGKQNKCSKIKEFMEKRNNRSLIPRIFHITQQLFDKFLLSVEATSRVIFTAAQKIQQILVIYSKCCGVICIDFIETTQLV